MRRPGLFFTCLALISVAHGSLGAQQLRGTVLDGAARAPLSGVVVSALDPSGATTARTISDAAGSFTLDLSSGASKLRLIRIGYRPREVPLPSTSGSLELAMERLPAILSAVRVSDTEICPGSPDRGAAFQLWEQARAGLLAAIVAREAKPAMATTLIYESGMSPSDDRINRQTKRTQVAQTTRPFAAAASPRFFAQQGYMIDDPSGRIFSAPDADVLLDESFVTTHCFHLQSADRDHPSQIGLAFAPARERDARVDVTGVIWLDAVTPQLRTLEFLYTSLEPAGMAIKSGGHIEFRSMPNGVVFIDRWSLRLPNLQIRSGFESRSQMPPARQDRRDARVAEIIESGGLVVDAQWPDGTAWHYRPSVVNGLVTQRGTHAPVAGAIVTLAGTGESVTTDSTGSFRLEAIPGKYTMNVSDTTLRTFMPPRTKSQPVQLPRDSTTTAHIEVAAIGEVVADICNGQKMTPTSVVLVGRVAPGAQYAPRTLSVRATWQAGYALRSASGLAIHNSDQEVSVDADGRFLVCGVANERPVSLRLLQGTTKIADTTAHVSTPTSTYRVDWRIGPPVPR